MTTKAYVLPIPGRETDVAALNSAIVQAGCTQVGGKSSPSSFDTQLKGADVLVVLICAESLANTAVDQAIGAARKLGKRIVGVWAKDTKDEKFPPGINQAASAVICFRLSDIKRAICGGENFWQDPQCEARVPPKTPRHKK